MCIYNADSVLARVVLRASPEVGRYLSANDLRLIRFKHDTGLKDHAYAVVGVSSLHKL